MDRKKIEELEKKKEAALRMGGDESIAKIKARGRLNTRERVNLLFDPNTFQELGLLADHAGISAELKGRQAAADGVITGYGKVDGRIVFVIAYDFSVLAGTMGRTGELKCARIRDLALKQRKPIVWLIDSAGARVQELGGSFFSTTGYLFREQVTLSGVLPQVSIIHGPGAAGTAYIPALSDCVIMVKDQSSLALGGPPLVEAVLGEKVTEQELGGSQVHLVKSGLAHIEAGNDSEAMEIARKYLSYFPSNCEEKPPIISGIQPRKPGDEILDIVPDSAGIPFDMQKIIDLLVDDDCLPYMNDFGRSVITSFARIGGYPIGIVANQSTVLGGVLENDSSVKAARFVSLCDAFGIPLLFLQDVPGFLVGSRVERSGIIRHGAKMLFAVSRATVPKISIVIRKAYGAGYYVMNGRGFEPDYIAAWPTAEIALMGAEGAINILYGKKLIQMGKDEGSKKRKELEDAYRNEVSPERAAAFFGIDEVIDPRETSLKVVSTLEMAWNKEVLRPRSKHGIFPV